MSSSPKPSRSRRVLLIIVGGIIALCVCVLLAAEFLVPTFNSSEPPDAAFATQIAPGAAQTSFPTFAIIMSTPTEEIASSEPTAAGQATEPPKPTAIPVPTSVTEELVTGELRLDYPLTLKLDSEEIVTVEIVPIQPVARVGSSPLAPAAKLLVESGGDAAPRKSASYEIPLYPAMSAELATASQDLNIVAGSESKQILNPFERNFWTWSLVARRGGEYRITLRVFGYAALTDDDPIKQIVSDTRIVRVNDRPFLERLSQGLADNWIVLFGAGGPIALIVAVLTLWLTRRDAQKSKK